MKTYHLYPTLIGGNGAMLPAILPIKLRIPTMPAGVAPEVAAALFRAILTAVTYAEGGIGPRQFKVVHCRTAELNEQGAEIPNTDAGQEPFGAVG